MIKRLQMLPAGPRIVIFILLFGGGLFMIIALAVLLLLSSLNSAERRVAEAVLEGVTIEEYVTLPDDDSYPAAIAAAPDGTLYTGSYATGALWSISPEGVVFELPSTRGKIGSITGLDVAPDGTLYILDRLVANPRSAGGAIWQFTTDAQLTQYAETLDTSTSFVSPDDIAVDRDGHVYITERGRREIWRFTAQGAGDIWWVDDSTASDLETLPTGLAYDGITHSLILTDAESDTLYRISIANKMTETIYQYDDTIENRPGFDGITVGPDGTIYVAAFASHEVMEVTEGEIKTLAGNFRGVSDIVYTDNKLYVTNFDSRSLVLPGIQPQLPFALDVMTLP